MSKNGTMDLTQGRPITQILLFALPLVVGTLFQQLYSFVDTVMVGRLVGDAALAAVGTTWSLYFFTIGFVQGSCAGFCIPLAQSIGAKDEREFKRYFWNGVWVSTIMAIVVAIATYLAADPLLRLINTPEEILADAVIYIRIIFLGIPATVLYNFCAGVLRAAGDSQRPTMFLLASSFLNIALDYVFIALLRMGVAGAALATVLSQFVSGLCNLLWLVFKTDLLHNSDGLRGASASHIKRLCKLGFPMGFEFSVSAIGAVILQGAINSFGTAVIAGQTAGEKIRRMFTLPMESVGVGMATYVGQNMGAERYDRIRDGIKAGWTIQITYCAVIWVVLFFLKKPLSVFVLGPEAADAVALSVQYLSIMSILFIGHGGVMLMRNTLQGMGYSFHAVLSGVGELAGRALGGWLAVNVLGYFGICISNPLAWILATAYCSVLVWYYLRKLMKKEI
ncbi:MAG: MATE family efflux transporter [Oscillospiraceae bacterium]|nr:MATE family efflux transporter [Oscillospiraceae bacterium]